MVAQIPPVTEFYFQRDVSYSDCASNRAFIEPPPALANIARICVIARLARISDAKGKRLIPTESSETNSSERTRNEYLRCICGVFFFLRSSFPFSSSSSTSTLLLRASTSSFVCEAGAHSDCIDVPVCLFAVGKKANNAEPDGNCEGSMQIFDGSGSGLGSWDRA